jgi:uncharacterized protein
MAQSELQTRLKSDIITAMKAKDKNTLGVLRMVQAAVKQVEIDERRDLSDADVIKVINSYARKVKDQIKSYGEGGREELKDAAVAELAIVQEYLPAEISDDELAAIVSGAISETGAASMADMGKLMKAVMPLTAGKADGGRVSAMVKKLLGK